MYAQLTLLPNESKKLIAKAIAGMSEVKRALHSGILVMHPSSSTLFLAEAILGRIPDTEVWMCGAITPRAACGDDAVKVWMTTHPEARGSGGPEAFPFSWVIEKSDLKQGETLSSLFKRMGPDDVYVKGVNAIDPDGKVGVLIGNHVEGGTIGKVIAAQKEKRFTIIYPVGLEKTIPVSIQDAVIAAKNRLALSYSMGSACSLLSCEGKVITEIKAIKLLSGATAVPIAAGGIDGAEGAITFVISGEEDQVKKAVACIEECKGAEISRQFRQTDCTKCNDNHCSLRGGKRPW
ncbi:MAG TPA: hypothetical protein VLH15_05085 [Dehalococcoidales bacterium]|nr:hypothetical protein [Dehalococcoidales bacterium]